MTSTTAAPEKKSVSPDVVRIIVLDNIAEQGLKMLDEAEGIEYEIHTGLAGPELREALEGFHGAVCRSGVKITDEALEGNTTLRAIARAGVGTDNIDKEAATRLGIVVMNTPGGNTVSTAEHTMALMLGLSRNIAPAHASLLAGKWDRSKFSGRQLQGKTLGIIGLGRIGQEVASRSASFGMQILGFDPYLSESQIASMRIQPAASIETLLPQVDYLTVHTPLTDETRGLINRDNLNSLKPGVRLINCARGGIYDEAALVEGLQSGQIGGVALDVYENEPCTESPLFAFPNVLCTPHLGASTEEAQVQVATEAVELLIGYLQHGEIRHAVNTAALDPKTVENLRGYLDATHRLGMMLSGWMDGGIEDVEVEYYGGIALQDHRVLTSALCAGLLAKASVRVNIINAQSLARDRGIKVNTATRDRHQSLGDMVCCTIRGGDQTRRASVSVFGNNMPRLTGIGDYRTDAFIDGILLLITHRDVPGVIGYIGNILAEEDVNISQMAVGRIDKSGGGTAIGVLNLDSPASEDALEKVARFQGIDSVKMIQLPPADELPDWLT